LWSLAATDLRAILPDAVPTLKPIGEKLLGLAGTVGLGLLEFVAAIIVAGFLYGPAPRMVEILRNGLRKVSGARGEEMLKLAGATIRNVSRGIVGVATIQALLAGIGFAAAGMRSAGFLTFVALMLGLVQLGASVLIIPVILWSWATMATTKALIFTAYMIPVSILDNVLKPLLMARGLEAPMPVILVGVIGGTIAYGMSGLFLGPIMLSVAWVLMIAWTRDDPSPPENA